MLFRSVFVPSLNIDIFTSSVKKFFKLNNILSTPTYTTNRYLKNNFCFDSQLILFASKGTAKHLNKIDWQKTSSSWLNDKRNKSPKEYTYQYTSFIKNYFSNKKTTIHPNQKNEKLLKILIQLSSSENELVFDPFAGSCSTHKAAISLNRKCITCDTTDYNKPI